MNFQLTKEDRDWLWGLAEKRNQTHRPEDSQKIEPSISEVMANMIGLVGEFVVAQCLSAEWNPVLPHGDNGVDLEVTGNTIQVKTTTHQSGRLVCHQAFICDAAVLVYVDREDWSGRICGWTSRRFWQVASRATVLKKDRPPVPAMSQSQLWPIAELQDVVRGLKR